VHVVQRGETLASIAYRYGTSVSALSAANGIRNPNLIYVGQRIRISGKSSGGGGGGTTPPPSGGGGKWIEVDLSSQRTYARQGDTIVRTFVVSTGISQYPTPTGSFRIYAKYPAVAMSGPGYYLPGVPHTMFFYRGYAIHGTYWHNNFGHPMSHGCVNLTRADAAWLYSWTPNGTLVVIHW
jgi:lipoprotein-anchoring transpeptidase ErfK/SrfK